MRIIGGALRGLKLADVGEGDAAAHLRPTSDRVREAAFNLLPESQMGFVGLARDEQTHQPHTYMSNLPSHLGGRPVLVLDPMLATGGSLLHCCELLVERVLADDIDRQRQRARRQYRARRGDDDGVFVLGAIVGRRLRKGGGGQRCGGQRGDEQFANHS